MQIEAEGAASTAHMKESSRIDVGGATISFVKKLFSLFSYYCR
jgi:hypothetical protein